MIHLQELLDHGGQLNTEPYATHFTDFSHDSRLTNPGELFIALQTSRADGHDYIPSALLAGATGVICTWLPHNPENATIILSDNPQHLIQRWAAHRLRTFQPMTIAVTGSIGKTTTKHAIATLLETLGPTFASRQSYNALPGLPIALARLNQNHRYAVLEFGADSHGEIQQLTTLFPPHIGVITAIGNVYGKSFGTLHNIAREHSTLLKNLPADGWAILNGDDPYVAPMHTLTPAHCITFGQQPSHTLSAADIRYSLRETRLRLHWQGHPALPDQPAATLEASMPLIGEPAIPIALAAISVALACGLPLESAADILQHIELLNGHLRPLPTESGAMVLDDTASASPPSIQSALRSLAVLPAQRRIVLLGDPGDHTPNPESNYREMGQQASAIADTLICKGDWGTTAIQAAHETRPDLPASVVYTATAALHALPADLGPGDLILMKGSANARMERIVAGLLDPTINPAHVLVRQEPVWHAIRIGMPDRPTAARIDLDAIAHNIRRLREIAGVPLMAVIKADAYGHGAVRVARAALCSHATALAVATLSEARTLREADITAPILVLGYTPPWQAREAVRLGIMCAIFEVDVARAFSAAAIALQREATVHVKIDTGMGRLGMPPDEAVPFLQALTDLPLLRVEGLYSHFATADSNDESFARLQLARFQQTVDQITVAGLRPPIIHMANSAALLRFPEARFDMVRPGIACYGLSPAEETPLPTDFRPALSFHTELAQVKSLPAGTALSYGGTFTTQRPSRIGTIPVGYADGFRRSPPWREVLIRGQRAPIVGRICMDYALVDVTDIAGAKRGDPVVIIGNQGEDCITADEVATWLGTINYEVVSAILPRVPREVEE
jgi:alanine racemase